MPKIEYEGAVISVETGVNLRKALMDVKLPLYNGIARAIHCRGLGPCGTCAVRIEGEVSGMTAVEKWRLNFPPHHAGSGLRLACQCKVMGDLKIQKYGGMWGNQTNSPGTD